MGWWLDLRLPRVIAGDATGLPLAGVVFPANIDEPKTVRALLHKLDDLGAGAPCTGGSCGRPTKVMVDAGTTDREASDLGKEFGVSVAVYSQDPRPNPPVAGRTAGHEEGHTL